MNEPSMLQPIHHDGKPNGAPLMVATRQLADGGVVPWIDDEPHGGEGGGLMQTRHADGSTVAVPNSPKVHRIATLVVSEGGFCTVNLTTLARQGRALTSHGVLVQATK